MQSPKMPIEQCYRFLKYQEGSEGDDLLFSAAAVVDGVVGSGYFNGTWDQRTTAGGADFAVVKLYSNGTVAWRWHVRVVELFRGDTQ